MPKSKEARDWEQKAQHLVDVIMHHFGEAKKFHQQKLYGREERHHVQIDRLMGELEAMVNSPRPSGAKPPKMPRLK
jgi:hypothetical protein